MPDRQLGLVDKMGGLDAALAEAARLAKLGKDDWHPRYIDPQPDFASTLLGGLMPEPAQAQMPTDLFGRAAWEQQMLFEQMAADLRMLMTAKGDPEVLRMLLLSLAMILMMLLRPAGLLPAHARYSKPELAGAGKEQA